MVTTDSLVTLERYLSMSPTIPVQVTLALHGPGNILCPARVLLRNDPRLTVDATDKMEDIPFTPNNMATNKEPCAIWYGFCVQGIVTVIRF